MSATKPNRKAARKLLIDLGPLLVFFATNFPRAGAGLHEDLRRDRRLHGRDGRSR